MALIARVSRLFRADLHGVLDRIEEPELLLREAIREMEDELAREQRRIAVLDRRTQYLSTKKQECQEDIRTLEAQLNVCFDAENEALARNLLRRRLEIELTLKRVQWEQAELEQDLGALKEGCEANRVRLEAMQNRIPRLVGNRYPESREKISAGADPAVRDADVEVALLQEKRRRERL